ncbi:MAG TPA: hypothetical protein VGB26_11815 [Nitrospiria bacterium]|jgi:hypothetical protein
MPKLLILFIIFGFLTGCGSEGGGDPNVNQGEGSAAKPANLFGDWNGQVFNKATGITTALNINVNRAVIFSKTQNGRTPNGAVEISGDIALKNNNCFKDTPITFSDQRVTGEEIKINLPYLNSIGDIHLVGTVGGNQITGTFEIIGGGICDGNKGTWSVTNSIPPAESFNNLFGPPLNILGEWEGTWSNQNSLSILNMAFKFISVTPQTPLNEVEVDGFLTLSPTPIPCSKIKLQPFTETISNDQISIKAQAMDDLNILVLSGVDIHFTGTLEPNKIGGSFKVSRPNNAPGLISCLGDTGTWEALPTKT